MVGLRRIRFEHVPVARFDDDPLNHVVALDVRA